MRASITLATLALLFQGCTVTVEPTQPSKTVISPQGNPIQPTGSECADRFGRADANSDGKVSLEEWSAADFSPPPPPGLSRPAVMPSADDLKASFKQYDRNGDGFLSSDELCAEG